MEKKLVEHCNDDGWPDEAVDCFGAPTKSDARPDSKDHCMKILTSSQTDKVMKDLTAIMAQEYKAAAPPPPPPPPPAATDPLPAEEIMDAGVAAAPEPTTNELPPICEEWAAQIAKLQTCRKLPAATRKGHQESLAILRKSFASMKTITPTVRQAYETSCKQGVDSALELRKLCR
jgi:hypothetical protein